MAHRLETAPAPDDALLSDVAVALGAPIQGCEYVTSGAAGHIYRLALPDGGSVILKTARPDRPATFENEAAGLAHLAATNTVPVPQVLAVTPHFLVLQDLGTPAAPPTDEAWEVFGEQVGRMHSVTAPNFGYYHPDTHDVSRETDGQNWLDFYASERIVPLFDYMRNPEVLTDADRAGILRIIEKLGAQVPATLPSLCHGDLWRENVHLGADGLLYLIDPAIDYTHPEADLAPTQMYEKFPPIFYEAYRRSHPLPENWVERLPLYQLKEILYMTGQFAHEDSLELLRKHITEIGP
ncbi:MAG: fructosamine kinase family protein [Cellulomonadaceae bacterium]|jgi:fructosamine-3-kinase|nr:fructosamine kinase family protein [Cellulomonadaceae bacterium]